MDLNQAKILHERGQVDQAIAAYDELLNDNFNNPEVLFYYGTALFQQNRFGLAAAVLEYVVKLKPGFQSAFQNLGNCYKAGLDYKKAEEIYKLGLKLGDDGQLFSCMGSLNVNTGTPQKSLDWFTKALATDPKNDIIRFNMGLAHLEMGNWEKGFPMYDLGFKGGNRPARQYAGLPLWDGNPKDTVIVWGEQGIGDEIMFASVLPDMMKNCKRVIFDCHPRLVKTFQGAFGIECHGTRKNHHLEWLPDSDADSHICLTTLANFYRKKDADFPGTAYLKADEKKVAEHRAKGNGKLRVGLSWTGGTSVTRANIRSFPLETLKLLLKHDCDFYSLQYTNTAAREVCALEEKSGIRVKHYPTLVESQDYDETVNFVASMDLVITVCTTIHHVAGALGIPCWTMVPDQPAWRYGIKGEKTPWYKSVKMYRQKEGDWDKVIHKINGDLYALNRELQGTEQKAA